MGSSAQISSGVCRCGSQEQVPEEGCVLVWVPEAGSRRVAETSSGRFRKILEGSGVCVGFGCRFRKVPKGWFRKVWQGSGGFPRV